MINSKQFLNPRTDFKHKLPFSGKESTAFTPMLRHDRPYHAIRQAVMRHTHGRAGHRDRTCYTNRQQMKRNDTQTHSRSQMARFPVAIPSALHTDVISQHRSQNKILFRCQPVQRTVDQQANGIDAFVTTEKQVDAFVVNRLHDKLNVLFFQTLDCKSLVLFVGCIQHHAAYSFLEFVNVVQKHFDVGRIQFHNQLMCIIGG